MQTVDESVRLVQFARYAGHRGRIQHHAAAGRVARDVESAADSGVAGTPTFFVNGRRQYGAYDIATLTAAVQQARVTPAPTE